MRLESSPGSQRLRLQSRLLAHLCPWPPCRLLLQRWCGLTLEPYSHFGLCSPLTPSCALLILRMTVQFIVQTGILRVKRAIIDNHMLGSQVWTGAAQVKHDIWSPHFLHFAKTGNTGAATPLGFSPRSLQDSAPGVAGAPSTFLNLGPGCLGPSICPALPQIQACNTGGSKMRGDIKGSTKQTGPE